MKKYFGYALLAVLWLSCEQKTPVQKQTTTSVTAVEDPPQWASEVTWYQIFVERFHNGDPSNDPTPVDLEGAYPGIVPSSWKVTPWTQDWYRQDPFFHELDGIKVFGRHSISSFDQKVQLRRYGGDLQGVLDKLDYLDSLGITAVYFNPLNDAPSSHKYDARYWHHIDRNFGPNPEKDLQTMADENPNDPATWTFTEADKLFIKVINEFHARGIRVILDYSWNHTGHTFWAWKDVVKNQRESAYADWYLVKQFDNPATAENEFVYSGWSGVTELPEIRKTVVHDLSKGVQAHEGNLYSEAVKAHIFAITKRWLDPNGDGDPSDGVDGFRLDVAGEVPLGFWREYRSVVRNVNPDAYLLGEIWWEKWPDRLLDPEPFLRGDVFDAPMNYRWYRVARHFFNASPDALSVSAFVDSLMFLQRNLRKQSTYAMMNLTSSHDAPRTLTSLYNKNKYKYNAKPGDDISYKINKPDDATYQTLKLLVAHQFTYVGAPSIWAGDEMGMWGADDPATRKPLLWPEFDFEPETTHPLNVKRPTDEVKFNEDVFDFYRKVISIRKENPVLLHGEIDFIKIDNENSVWAYSRYTDADEVIVVFNAGTTPQVIDLKTKTDNQYSDRLGNNPVKKDDRMLTIHLKERTAAILVTGK